MFKMEENYGPGVYSPTGFIPVKPPLGPSVPADVASIFNQPSVENTRGFLRPYLFTGLFSVASFITVAVGKASIRRPMFSGIQHHLIFTVLGGGLGFGVDRYLTLRNRDRDAVLHHYITLHPEDFVQPERKKLSEVVEKWYPFR